MSEVTINESGFRRMFETPDGAMGRYLGRRMVGVTRRALHGASGRPGPEIRSGDLLRGTRFIGVVPTSARSIAAIVVSGARHGGFNYPIAQELGGVTPTGGIYRYPFLEPALAEEFGQPYRGGSR